MIEKSLYSKPNITTPPFSSTSLTSPSVSLENASHSSIPTPPAFFNIDSFPTYPPAFPSEISVVKFDSEQELVWVGHASGNLRSFSMPHAEAYTARQIDYQPILDIATDLRFHQGILVLTSDYVKLLHRRGLPVFTFAAKPTPLSSFLSMCFASNPPTHELVLSTKSPASLAVLNIQRGELISSTPLIPSPFHSPVQCLRSVSSHTFLTAHAQGTLALVDARTWKPVGTMAVHPGSFSDVLVYPDEFTVFASGVAHRNHTGSTLTVLDLRTFSRSAHLPYTQTHQLSCLEPYILTVSNSHLHCIHALTHQCMESYGLETWVNTLNVSLSKEWIALGDIQGHVHLVSTLSAPLSSSSSSSSSSSLPSSPTSSSSILMPIRGQVNHLSDPLELPSYVYPMDPIPFHPQVPLNLFGVPPCPTGTYLSSPWPSEVSYSKSLIPAPLDASFLAQAKWTSGGAIGFVPKPPNTPHQRWPYTHLTPTPTFFKSTKQKKMSPKKPTSPNTTTMLTSTAKLSSTMMSSTATSSSVSSSSSFSSSVSTTSDVHSSSSLSSHSTSMGTSASSPYMTSSISNSLLSSSVMNDYKKMSIQYSKFGVHDFDFHFFNPTNYSGLETDVEHVYLNNYLQTLFFSSPFNAIAITHAYTICEKETCLLCEMGFLFRTLQQSKGLTCRTTHWSYVFGQLPETEVLNLREHPHLPFPSLATTLQHCARYLMDVFHKESNQACHDYLTRMEALETCALCKQAHEKPANVFLVDLSYPGRRANHSEVSFVDLLTESFTTSSTNRGWCDHCKQYVTLSKTKTVLKFPNVLQIACHVKSDWNKDWWCNQETTFLNHSSSSFLPEKIRLHLSDPELKVQCEIPSDDSPEGVYILTAIVCEVLDVEPHIISHIHVLDDEWYLFNDFKVRQVPNTHVFQFPNWKIPCILQYTKLSHINKEGLLSPVWSKASFLEEAGVLNPDRCAPLAYPLSSHEIGPQFICAIDTEFVSLREEVAEFASDGTKTIVKPAHLTLARVSMIRAQEGPLQGTVCLDDFVMPKAPVIDYLTPYSGITAEDLNPTTSKQRLVSLKTVYRKLRYMVDHGVKFIGHDLAQDFRILHLTVPEHQLLDTVQLYFLPLFHRKLSLKFLAWAVLGLDIQLTTHDSIEDATIALALYKKHADSDAKQWNQLINEVYRLGALYGYRPPPPTSSVS